MDYDIRHNLIHEKFILKMAKMYMAPKNIANDSEAKKMYCRELRNAINKRIDSGADEKTFLSMLEKVWDRCIADQSYRLWFTPALVSKHASKVNAERRETINVTNAKVEQAFSPENKAERPPKYDAAGGGWTIEKCDEHIANMERMIADGEIGGHMGRKLANIPRVAKERLINAGHKPANSLSYGVGVKS
jgi:hypothetical protein